MLYIRIEVHVDLGLIRFESKYNFEKKPHKYKMHNTREKYNIMMGLDERKPLHSIMEQYCHKKHDFKTQFANQRKF